MNRKEGGTGGGKEGSPQLEPGRKLPGTGARRRQARLEARRRQARLEARRNGARRRRFSEFFGVKREKKRDNCLISNKNH